MNRSIKSLSIIVVLVLLLGGGISAVAYTQSKGSSDSNTASFYTVERKALSIDLTETGTIKSRDQHVIKNQVEGRTSVIFVIEEGVVVKEGDLLIELDSSSLEDRLVDQQIQVENTDADFVSAQENLEVVKIQSQSNIATARQNNQFAIEDKTKYIDGEWPKTLMQTETDLTLAQEDFRRATDEFDWSQKLYDEKYLSETEYRADELAKKRAELQVALAEENLSLLKEYTHKRKLDELDSEITQKELALERVNRESSSNIVQAQARLRAYEAELKRQKNRLEKIQDQISKTKMYAPADGMVVYASSSEFSWRGDSEPLDEGQEVYERQELIHLPTAESMMVVIQIQESALGKIKLGQHVDISIDALPNQSFTGKITKLAPLPNAASVFMNPDLKVYDTQIMIDGVYPEIRTGMSCKATVNIERYEDAISVPIQAIVGNNGESIVYVDNGNETVAREVEIGLDNNAMVHVLSGIQEGDRVLLTPPLENIESKKNRDNSTGSATASTEGSKSQGLQAKKTSGAQAGNKSGQPAKMQSGNRP